MRDGSAAAAAAAAGREAGMARDIDISTGQRLSVWRSSGGSAGQESLARQVQFSSIILSQSLSHFPAHNISVSLGSSALDKSQTCCSRILLGSPILQSGDLSVLSG